MDKFGNEGRVRYGSGSNPVQSGGFKSGSVRYACKLSWENVIMVTNGVRIVVTAGHLRIMVTTEGV